MSSQPDAPDLQLQILQEKGRVFAIRNDFLVIPIPYLDANSELRRGFLADPLNRPDGVKIEKPKNHQMYFIGDEPFGLVGQSLVSNNGPLGGGENRTQIFGENYSSFLFSHKIREAGVDRDYIDVVEKAEQHYKFISAPATHKFGKPDAAFFAVDFDSELETPFHFPDTHSSHNELIELNTPFRSLRVAIIGLGGTGSYVLDFIAKFPVREIRIIDDDEFSVKSAYRAPSCGRKEEFKEPKVNVYAARYGNFRNGITAISERLTPANAHHMDGVDFAFSCVDDGVTRSAIVNILNERGIPFIDCGMGLGKERGGLEGMVRTTLVTNETRERVFREHRIPVVPEPENVYQNNIQIAEINGLNAAIAVMLFKKHFGFYIDDEPIYNSIILINKLTNYRQRLI